MHGRLCIETLLATMLANDLLMFNNSVSTFLITCLILYRAFPLNIYE